MASESRAIAVRHIRMLRAMEAKLVSAADDWTDIDQFFVDEFDGLCEDLRAQIAALEEVYPGRRKAP